MKRLLLVVFVCSALAPFAAQAHEVYVLTPSQVTADIATPRFSELAVIMQDMSRFVFWGFIAVLTVLIVFLVSVSRAIETRLDPLLIRLRPYAPVVSRVTLGLAFLAAAWFHAAFGPELPMVGTWDSHAYLIDGAFAVLGVLLVLGLYQRLVAIAGLVLFAAYVAAYGMYMLTYANYAGELIALLLLAGTNGKLRERYAFLILRIAFGISLLYASLYAKILHNRLALDVASLPLAGHATSVAVALGFEPHFLVLGAAIVEIVISLFFILGIEIRFTALFLEFWLILSLLYFGEVVWPHLILIGIPLAFICYGYDRFSLEGRFFKRGGREPVL